jgi:hypothetical protein
MPGFCLYGNPIKDVSNTQDGQVGRGAWGLGLGVRDWRMAIGDLRSAIALGVAGSGMGAGSRQQVAGRWQPAAGGV